MAEGKVIYDKEYEYKGTYEYTGFPITGEGYFISISKQKKIIYNGKWENRNGKGTITLPDGKEIETECKFGCLCEYPYLLKGEYISNISHKSSSWFK
ncbi:MAG: hypothetical protein MJ252_20970, partial [archaeon]|nr:hypothetical protein [archaeon]